MLNEPDARSGLPVVKSQPQEGDNTMSTTLGARTAELLAANTNPAVGTYPMLVGGKWVQAASGEATDVTTPAHRGRVIARVPSADAEDVNRAVVAAREAQPEWAAKHFKVRQRALAQIADAVEARAEELAKVTAIDTGNALRTQARPEVGTLVDMFRYFAGVAGEVKGTVLPAGDGQLQYTRRDPLGVVGCILPWNSPLMIAAFKLPAALAAGNAVVVKAADAAPLSVLLLAEICEEYLPAGVLNVLTGSGSRCGNAIVEHAGVDKVSFTGSTEVGRGVARLASQRLAHVSLELGGKNPSIVFPDALDDDLVENLLLSTRLHRQGQSCTAGSRILVHEDVHEQLLDRLVKRLDQLVVGDPLDEKSDIGAIINEAQFSSVSEYLADGCAQAGIKVALGGGAPSDGPLTEGYYHTPTVFDSVKPDWRISREEIFGPVLVVTPWRDVDEAIRLANDTHYGLAAYVWSHNLDAALNTAHRVDAGWVQVNQGGGQVVGQSYGGVKQSGLGREVSLEGMLEGFTQIKQVNVRIADVK